MPRILRAMARCVRWYVLGFGLVTLAGCSHGLMQYAQRAPWRADAETSCLKSGALQEGPGRVRITAIDGPGVCGATQPFKISLLGESNPLGFADEPIRPPGTVAGVSRGSAAPQPPWPGGVSRAGVLAAPPNYAAPSAAGPLSIQAPGTVIDADDAEPPHQILGAPPRDLGTLRMTPGGVSAAPEEPESEPEPGSWPRTVPAARPEVAQPLPALGPQRGPQGTVTPVELKPAATLACPIVSALDRWIANAVQPAAQHWFGQPVVEIKQISAYSCRGMNGQPGAHISEHAFGNALDIAAFVFADGRRLTVKNGWHGAAEEQGFLRDVQGAACDQFTTVLAPGSNRFHYDHIHVDLMRRASGRRICQPGAVDGELIASRLRKDPATRLAVKSEPPPTRRYDPPFDTRNDPFAWRGDAARRGDPATTGSVGSRRGTAKKPLADEDDDWVEDDGPR